MPALVPSRLPRWLLVSVAALVGAVALFAILGYAVAPRLAKSKLEEVLSRELGRTTTVERVEVRPFSLAATVHGLAVREPQGDAVALSVESIDADVSIASLTALAPVLDALKVVRPHLRVARLDANRYSVSDLIEKWTAPRTEPPARYSLNNIEVHGGRVDFDDRPVRRAHVVAGLEVGVPFLSTLPYEVEINVEPKLEGNVNGTPFALAGRATPFAAERRAEIDIDVDALPLPQYVDYLPARPRVGVKDGRLTTRLKLHFAQRPGEGPTWWVDGTANVDALDVRRRDGAPLVAVARANARLERLDVGARELRVAGIEIDGPSAAVRRLPDGAFELAGGLFEPAPAASADPAAAPWQIAVAAVSVANGRATLEDASVAPAYRANLANFKGRASSLSTAAGAKGAVEFSLDVDEAFGELKGEVALAPFAVTGTFATRNASIARLYPYVAELLDVEIQRGRADFAASFAIAPGGVTIAGGQGALTDVALAQRGEREPLWRSSRIAFAGVALDTGKRAMTIGEVTAERLFADLRRDRDGTWNYARLLRIERDGDGEGGGGAKAATGGGWQVVVDRIAAARGEVRFRDLHAPTPIELSFDQLDVSLTGASNAPGAKAAIDFASRVNRTGRLRAKGQLGTNPVAATLTLDASRIALMPFRTYIERALAVTLTGGSASARGTLDAAFPPDAAARVRWTGNMALEDFGANDPPTGSRLLAWKTLRFEGTKANLDPFDASAESIALEDFYARVIVYSDGTLNLARIAQGEEATAGPAAPQATAQSRTRRSRALAGTTTAVGSAAAAAGRTLRRASDGSLPLSIGRISLAGGNVNFSDFFVRPNYSVNLTGVAGTVSAMSPAQAGTIDLTAKVDDAAPVEIHGELAPFARELSFRLTGSARDIELPPLSPYSAKYAGYGITRGKMSFQVDYRVDNRKLDAKNRLVLDQLTFGEKVDSPDATKLPVLFAVSLLKDANGVIDLDIPISGSLDDPQFSMFAIVVKIIVNLLTKAATAPFALLSSIAGGAGGAGEDLAVLEFAAGSAAIEGEAAARVERLAKALANRPALKVDVTGRVDAASDAEGLARGALERELRSAKLAAVAGTPDEAASVEAVKLAPEERAQWIAWLYRNTPIEGRPRDAAGALAEVPAAAMEAALAKHFAPPAGAVPELALQRARAAKDALVARGVPAERVFLVSPRAGEAPAAKGSPRRVDFALR